jgi:hypothetical protein
MEYNYWISFTYCKSRFYCYRNNEESLKKLLTNLNTNVNVTEIITNYENYKGN